MWLPGRNRTKNIKLKKYARFFHTLLLVFLILNRIITEEYRKLLKALKDLQHIQALVVFSFTVPRNVLSHYNFFFAGLFIVSIISHHWKYVVPIVDKGRLHISPTTCSLLELRAYSFFHSYNRVNEYFINYGQARNMLIKFFYCLL